MNKPLKYEDLYPQRFLRHQHLDGKEPTVTITAVDAEELLQDNGKMEVRGILSFKETKLQMTLNSTNGQFLKGMFGNRPQEWVGKRVSLRTEPATLKGEDTAGIRIFGSPDLEHDLEVPLTLPRKRARQVTMQCTRKEKEQ